MTTILLTNWPKLRLYGQNGQGNFDPDHPQNYQIFMVKMVNPNLIMTIFTIPDFFVLKIVEVLKFIVEIPVNLDHLTMTI
jgi:hypothetical protein